MADPIKLAYFMAVKEGASYLGGLLVTDPSGIPLDFRYTEPITPTRLQGILYGKSLEPHLKEEVIQKTLLKELKTAPDLFILSATELAGGWSGDPRFPALAVQKSQEQPLARPGDVVVATGKGSEQWIHGPDNKKTPWNERRVIEELLK